MSPGILFFAGFPVSLWAKYSFMQKTLNPPAPRPAANRPILHVLLIAMLCALCYLTYNQLQQIHRDRVNMEKSPGKHGKHSNPDARSSAEQQYDKAKQEFDQLFSKTNKTKEDVKILKKLKKQLEHWRKKKIGKENIIRKNTKASKYVIIYIYC